METYGSLDMLVNNAGGQFVCSGEDLSGGGFAAVVDTNLKGTFVCCREAYTQYMRDHGGSIVNITLNMRNGISSMVHSGAARAGVENMTGKDKPALTCFFLNAKLILFQLFDCVTLKATLCSEWIESNVRINCVRPGIIWTER